MNGTRNTKEIKKGQDLYDAVKAGFTLRGTTLAVWCRKNDMLAANARQALMGSWTGPKATALTNKLIKASQAAELLNLKRASSND